MSVVCARRPLAYQLYCSSCLHGAVVLTVCFTVDFAFQLVDLLIFCYSLLAHFQSLPLFLSLCISDSILCFDIKLYFHVIKVLHVNRSVAMVFFQMYAAIEEGGK